MAKAAPTVYTAIVMDDGRTIQFPGDRRLMKEAIVDKDTGAVAVRLDFRNGETRLFTIPPSLLLDFAGHGALQKYGDATSGLKDLAQMVEAVDDVDETIQSGNWSAVREGTGAGLSGASILARALVEVTGQPIAVVREFLGKQDAKTKMALRASAEIKPTIDRLEAERKARAEARGVKVSGVDTGAVLGGLMALPKAA